MKKSNLPLPDFSNPPVVEVALSVQFDSIPDLRVPQMGLLWRRFRDRFPRTEEHPPLEPVVERFGVHRMGRGDVRIEMTGAPPVPRCWFLDEAGTELVQIQQDRFIRNWRKRGAETEYPRYEHLRDQFYADLERFAQFVQEENLGNFVPNQCEVTYVNHIVGGHSWQAHGDLAKVLSVLQPGFPDHFLPVPEDAGIRMRFQIKDGSGAPVGRLHITCNPGYRSSDDQPMFILALTARGAPRGPCLSDVLDFLDLGREWVVRGFASVTTSLMHSEWGRRNGTGD